MTKVIGVRFRKAGKVYYFSPGDREIKTGDHVIVETARGIEYGYVVLGSHDVDDKKVVQPLKPVIRMATAADEEVEQKNEEKEKEAFKICLEKIKKHELVMKLIDAEYTFDNNKVLFYFTADGRIDFRELVKDLASVFKTRIELRQIGVRDETKIVGGIGICGRPLCCASYLSEFIPVSIKMAKEQNLSLNPTKISGVCGRLMCCLKYEEETYEELNGRLPNLGDHVITDDGLKGEVHSVSILRQIVKVIVVVDGDEKEIREYKVDQLKFRPKRRKDRDRDGDGEIFDEDELRQLEELDKQEGKTKPGNKRSDGRRPDGKRQDGRKSEGRQSEGNQTDRRKIYGRQSEGNPADDRKSYGRQSEGNPADDRKSYGRQSEGNQPDDRKPYGRQSGGTKADDRRPYGRQSEGNQPDGRRPYGRQSDRRRSEGRRFDGRRQDDRRPDGKRTD